MGSQAREFNETDFRDMSIRVLNIIMPSVYIVLTLWVLRGAPDRLAYLPPFALLFLLNMSVSRLQARDRFRANPWLSTGRFAVSFPLLAWMAWLHRGSGYGWIFLVPHAFALPFSFLMPIRIYAQLAWLAAAMGFALAAGMHSAWGRPLAALLIVSAVAGFGAKVLERNLGLIQKLPAQDRRKWGRAIGNQALVSYVVLLAGAGLTLLLLRNESEHRRQAAESKLRERASTAVANMEIRLATQRGALEALAGFFHGSTKVEREEFSVFANRLLLHMPAVLAFEWIPKAAAIPPDTGYRLPIRFVEPFERYRADSGMDIRRAPDRSACAERALALRAYVVCRAAPGQAGEDLAYAFLPVETPSGSGLVAALLSQTKVAQLAHQDVLTTGMAVGVDFLAGADRFPILDPGPAEGVPVLERTVKDSGGGGYSMRIRAPHSMLAAGWGMGQIAFLFMGLGLSILLAYFLFHSGRASLPLEIKVLERTEELRRTVLRVEEANEAKTRFLAHMSHEIRTPLHGVLGLSQALLRADLPPASRENAELIRASGLSLMGIVNEALDVSKIESGRLELEAKPFSPAGLLEEVTGTFKAEAVAKGIRLELRPEPGLPPYVSGDRLRVRQILANLIGNAVKFTEAGSVTVGAAFTDPDRLRIRIADTGVGISGAKLEKLFQPFEQGDSGTAGRFGGTGLGLVISRQLARKMAGDIRATSREGVGSEFEATLSLPACPAPAAPSDGALPALRKGGRLLLAEDNAVNVKVAVALLSDHFEAIDVASNGKEALDLMGRARYDLILMDIRMPVMGGIEAARAIRRNPEWSGIPIIALTANAFSSDREECFEAGMVDFLEKPITRQALQAVLGRYLGATAA